jgi:hypothetical protein
MITITKKQDKFLVKFHGTHKSAVATNQILVSSEMEAVSACRCRTNKFKESEFSKDKLKVIKIPFIGLWLVW